MVPPQTSHIPFPPSRGRGGATRRWPRSALRPGSRGVLAADCRQLQGHRCDDEGGDANRQVDIEDPPPAGSVGEPAAQQWSRYAGDAEHRPKISLVPTALARGDDVADDTERE